MNNQSLITSQNFNGQNYNNIAIPSPPKTKQTEIVVYIQAETAKIDQAIAKAAKEITFIQEYKEAMIAEAVLSKLDHHIMGSCSEIPNTSPQTTPSQEVNNAHQPL